MDGKGISGFLKLGALFVCLSFLFSGAMSAFQNETFVSEEDNGPVTAGETPTPAVVEGEAEDVQVEAAEELPWYGEPNGRGNDIFVPGSFWTISAAVENASAGDRILVNEPFLGTEYNEGQIEVDKSLEIIGLGMDVVTLGPLGTWAFHVTANDVLISGFNIELDGGDGIWIEGCENVTVSWCAMESANYLVLANETSSDVHVLNNSLIESENKVFFNDTTGCTVMGNYLEGHYTGIVAHNSSDLEIGYNVIEDSIVFSDWTEDGIGVLIGNATDNVRIHHNFIGDSGTSGIAVDGYGEANTHHIWIENNTIDSAYIHGINVTNGANEVHIYNNSLDEFWENGYVSFADAIYVSEASRVFIGSDESGLTRGVADSLKPWGNIITNAERAVTVVHGSEDVLIAKNTISESDVGVWMEDVPTAPPTRAINGYSAGIIANDIQWCYEVGVTLMRCNSTILQENIIGNISDNGVWMVNSSHNSIQSNMIHNNNDFGLYLLAGSNYNNIVYNDIRFNLYGGIALKDNIGNTVEGNHVNANGLTASEPRGGERGNEATVIVLPPSTPYDLDSTYGSDYVHLSWYCDDYPDYFDIYRGTTSGSLSLLYHYTTTRTAAFDFYYNDTTVSEGTTYYYHVVAGNSAGESDPSEEYSCTPGDPMVPRSLDHQTGDGYVHMTWSAPEQIGGYGIDKYRIYRGTSPGAGSWLVDVQMASRVGPPVREYNDTSVINGVEYYYTVTAYNLGANEGPDSNEINSIPGTYPSAPQNLEVTYGLGFAYLEWDEPSESGDPAYTHSNIYRGTDPGSMTHVGSIDAPVVRGVAGLEFYDYTIQPYQIYYYEVASENNLGEGTPGTLAAFDPWPTFGHDAARQGLSEFPTDHNAGSVMWTYDTGNLLFGSAAVDRNGTLYVASYNNYLYAITPNGTMDWSFFSGDPIHSPPTVLENGTVYFGNNASNLYALNQDGSHRWTFPTDAPVLGSPAVDSSGNIYIGTIGGTIYKVDPTGNEVARNTTGGFAIHGSPAVAPNGNIYIGCDDGTVRGFDSSFTSILNYSTGAPVWSTPTVLANGSVYFGSDDGFMYALTPALGADWAYDAGSPIRGSPAVAADGTIYFGTTNPSLVAVYPNGSLNWDQPLGGAANSTPAIGADGNVYITAEDGLLYAFDDTGTPLWNVTSGGGVQTSPVIASTGAIYFGSHDGLLYAVGNVPSEPLNLTVSGGPVMVSLHWDAPAFDDGIDITGYNIYRSVGDNTSFILYAWVDNATFEYVDYACSGGQTYYYMVNATNFMTEGPGTEGYDTAKSIPNLSPAGIYLYNELGATITGNHISNPVENVRDIYFDMYYDPNVWEDNYYGDYTGIDMDLDYVGEESYVIPGRNWISTEHMVDDTPRTKVLIEGTTMSTMMIKTAVGNQDGPTFDDGLVAHWKLDEAAFTGAADEVVDITGSGHSGTSNANLNTTAGVMEGAAQFDGLDDYIDVPYDDALNTQTLTISFWARAEGAQGTYRVPLSTRDSAPSPNRGWNFYASNSNTWEFWLGESNDWSKTYGNAVVLDEWIHLVATFDDYWVRFYNDGVEVASDYPSSTYYPNTVKSLLIGARTDAYPPTIGTPFNGSIDDVRLYDRALSADEILALYGEGDRKVAHLEMDEASWDGSTYEVIDSSGAGNYGTISGDPDTSPSGMFGFAGAFDGVGDYVTLPDSPSLDLSDMTISTWVRFTAVGSTQHIICKGYLGDPENTTYELYLDSDNRLKYQYEYGGGTNANILQTTSTLGPNLWYHVAVTQDGLTSKLYLDFVLEDTEVQAGAPGPNDREVHIGARYNGGMQNHLSGMLDDLQMYGRALTAAEIYALKGVPTTIGVPEGIDGYYYETVRVENRTDLTIHKGGVVPSGTFDGYFTDLPNVTCHYDFNENSTFYVYGGDNITIDEILAFGGKRGFTFESTVDGTLKNSVAYLTGYDDYYSSCAGAYITDTTDMYVGYNNFSQNWFAGMMMQDSTTPIIEYNNLSHNGYYLWWDRGSDWYEKPWYSAMALWNCDNGTIYENDLWDNIEHGIYLDSCHQMNVEANWAQGHDWNWDTSGILLYNTRDSIVTDNDLHHNEIGVHAGMSSDNTAIVGNRLDHNDEYGIFVTDSLVYSIEDNTLVENDYYGIYYDFLYGEDDRRVGYPTDYRNKWSFQFPQPLSILNNTVHGDYEEDSDMYGVYVANVGRQSANGGTGMWYSGTGAAYVATMYREVDLTSHVNPYLEFYEFYDLADDDDYIFINVSDDGQYYKWNIYIKKGERTSEEWTRTILDISEFAGMKIWLRFQYVTDLFQSPEDDFYGGWWLDDIRLFDTTSSVSAFKDDMETGATSGTKYGDWVSGGLPVSAQPFMATGTGSGNLYSRLATDDWPAGTLVSSGDYITFVESATHVSTGRMAMLTLDTNYDVVGYVYEDGGWDAGTTLATSAGYYSERCMDVEFETLSGDIIAVFADYDSQTGWYYPHYSEYKDGSWSTPETIYNSDAYQSYVRWVDMDADPNSNHVAAATLTTYSNNRIYGYVWDGNSWSASNAYIYGSAYRGDSKCFDIFYETISSDLNVVVGTTSQPRIYHWNPTSTSWTYGGTQPGWGWNYDTYWVDVATHPFTDEAIYCSWGIYSSDGFFALPWTGSSWNTGQPLFRTGSRPAHYYSQSVDAVYEEDSGIPHMYFTSNTYGYQNIYEYTYQGSWSGPSHVATAGTNIFWIEAKCQPESNNILLSALDDWNDIYTWNTSYSGSTQQMTTIYDETYLDNDRSYDINWLAEPSEAWEWGAPSNVGPSGPPTPLNLWGTDLDANYVNDTTYSLDSPSFDLSGTYLGAQLTFKHWMDVEDGKHDGGIVEVRAGNHGWEQIDPDNVQKQYTGTISDDDNYLDGKKAFCTDVNTWTTVTFNLPPWTAGSDDVRLRWTFVSDEDGGVGAGWYIDDVEVNEIHPDPLKTPIDDDVEGGGDAQWVSNQWIDVDRSIIFEDNEVQGTHVGVWLEGSGATAFNRNNVSYNMGAVYIDNADGIWDDRRSEPADNKDPDDILEYELEFNDNEISHNRGTHDWWTDYYYRNNWMDLPCRIVTILTDSGHPMKMNMTGNVMTYNEYDVFQFFSGHNATFSQVSNNYMSDNWGDSGEWDYYDSRYSVADGRSWLMYFGIYEDYNLMMGSFDNNTLQKSGRGLEIRGGYMDDEYGGSIYIGRFNDNLFSDLASDGGEKNNCETQNWGVDIRGCGITINMPDMTRNTFYKSKGVMIRPSNEDMEEEEERRGIPIKPDVNDAITSYFCIYNNTFKDHYGPGLKIQGANHEIGVIIHDNTFEKNGKAGLWVKVARGQNENGHMYVNIHNNTMTKNKVFGFVLEVGDEPGMWIEGMVTDNKIDKNGGKTWCDSDTHMGGAWLKLKNSRVTFERNTFNDNTGGGFKLSSNDQVAGQYILFDNNEICRNSGYWEDCSDDGIVGGVHLGYTAGIEFRNNRIADNHGSNMWIIECENINISGGNQITGALPFEGEILSTRTIADPDGFGICMQYDYDIRINDWTGQNPNIISGNYADGIYMEDCYPVLIGNNTIAENGENGIETYNDCGNIEISNNTIEKNGENGIYDEESWGTWIADNDIRDNKETGIFIWDYDTDHLRVYDNGINGNGEDGFYYGYPEGGRSGTHHGTWYDVELWLLNNDIKNNDGWGFYMDDPDDEVFVIWTVDGNATVVNNPVFLDNGEISVKDSATFNTNGAEFYFIPGHGIMVNDGGTLNSFDTVWTHRAFMNMSSVWTGGYWVMEINGSATFSDCRINYTDTIDCRNAELVTLTRTNVSHTQSHGLTVSQCPDVQIDFSHISMAGGDGLNMKDSHADIESSWFYNCHDGINAKGSGLKVYGTSAFFGNSGSGDGIDMYDMVDASITGAVFHDNQNHAVRAQDTPVLSIADCIMYDNGGDGIFLTSSGTELFPVVSSDNVVYSCDAGITATKGSFLNSDRDNFTANLDGYNVLDNSHGTADDGYLDNDVLDLFVSDGSHFVVTNIPHDEAKATVQNTGLGTGTLLEVRWYITVLVNDLGAPVEGANVTLSASSTYLPIPDYMETGADGKTDRFICWGYVMTFTSKDTSMNPHDVDVTIDTHSGPEMVDDQFTADKTKTVVVGVNLPPEAVGSISTRTFEEGGTYGGAFDLDDYFFDREPLNITVSGNTCVTAAIAEDGTVDLSTSDPDWHGTETVTFTATDSLGQLATQNVKVVVLSVNDLPWLENVVITPGGAKTADALTVVYDWLDVDTLYDPGDNESAPGVRWYRDGQLVDDLDDLLTVPSSNTAKGQLWFAIVTPRDHLLMNGTPATSANITIGNTAPKFSNATLSPELVFVDTKIKVTPKGWSDADGDEPGYVYAWQINRNGVWEYLDNQSSSVLMPGPFVKDDQIRAEVQAHDGENGGTVRFSDEVTVLNSPPVVLGASISPGSPTKTQTLLAIVSDTYDADGDPVVSYTHTWYLNGAQIGGETGAQLDSSWFTTGDEVHVAIAASDGEDQGEPTPSAPVTVLNTAPTIASVLLSPDEPNDSTNITALPQLYFDADGDPADTPRVKWYINSEALDNFTTVLDFTHFAVGDVIFAVVEPYDGEDYGPGVASSSVKIVVTPADEDGDGIPDNDDNDIDGDGVLNEQDAFPYDGTETGDIDGDGIGDNTDPDRDGDNVPNGDDDFPRDPDEFRDTDGDGIGDNSDSDIDGDGVPNADDEDPYDDSKDESLTQAQSAQEMMFNGTVIAFLILLLIILLLFFLAQKKREKDARAKWEDGASASGAAAGAGTEAKDVEDMSGMSKCSECDAIIPAEATVCPECGADFSDEGDDDDLDEPDADEDMEEPEPEEEVEPPDEGEEL